LTFAADGYAHDPEETAPVGGSGRPDGPGRGYRAGAFGVQRQSGVLRIAVRQVRLGGLVENGTIVKSENGKAGVQFKVTDGKDSVPVVFKGILPDLFREGQGVVVLGIEQQNGVFKASEVLAKHDAAYMPKEVEEALKKSGRWNPSAGPPPPASTWNEPAAKPRG
jgi:cytochrome c-type biogenesis protein CcmE